MYRGVFEQSTDKRAIWPSRVSTSLRFTARFEAIFMPEKSQTG